MTRQVVVIGGGIAGLTAFRRVQKQPGVNAVLLEASSHFGGKIRTTNFLGLTVDEGADDYITRVR